MPGMNTIAYLGPEQTNTHMAAMKRFGRRALYIHAPTVDDLFIAVERQRADYGVVPVENSLEGAVTHTLDRFIDFKHSPVKIHSEMEQPIRHALIIYKHAKFESVKVVFSHPQALAQSRRWLDEHLRHAERRETNSTAEAVHELLNPSRTTTYIEGAGVNRGPRPFERAAIARSELATGKLRAIHIPDQRENRTRFLMIGLGEASRRGRSKTSVLFALKDKPGALHDVLAPFKRHRINLTKIESRPSKRKAWQYLFFIDFEGHLQERRVQRALTTLKRHTTDLQVLGSYPCSRP